MKHRFCKACNLLHVTWHDFKVLDEKARGFYKGVPILRSEQEADEECFAWLKEQGLPIGLMQCQACDELPDCCEECGERFAVVKSQAVGGLEIWLNGKHVQTVEGEGTFVVPLVIRGPERIEVRVSSPEPCSVVWGANVEVFE